MKLFQETVKIMCSSFDKILAILMLEKAMTKVLKLTIKMIFILNIFFLSLTNVVATAGVPAFPGAEGGGANAIGGRGGRIIEVTNLNDSGPGSFRAACEAKGARIVVFRVSGTIQLNDWVRIWHPYLTIAGQTAPGGGICIRGAGILVKNHDIIIRFLRIRPGKNSGKKDGLWIQSGAYNVVVDHCSFSWATDENLSIASDIPPAHNITFSWNLIGEGLQPHSCGSLIYNRKGSLQSNNISIHHNMYIHNHNRNPIVGTASARIINNIIYDWSQFPIRILGGLHVDIIGNIIKPGPNIQPGKRHLYSVWWSKDYGDPAQCVPGNPSIYIYNNYGPNQHDFSGDDWNMILDLNDKLEKATTQRSAPLPESTPPITINTIHSVKDLEDILLDEIGASKRLDDKGHWIFNRDDVDKRLISEYQTGTGKIPFTENEVGGYPILDQGIPPKDSDHDGMPDTWELAYGLNPNNPSDAAQDKDNDGYTNIEEYLNGTFQSASTDLSKPTNLKVEAVLTP